jgi:hypothetical protein
MAEWFSRGYYSIINKKNLSMLFDILKKDNLYHQHMLGLVHWITPEVITTHRSVLIQKKPEHYQKLWHDCPRDLKMRYDWSEHII